LRARVENWGEFVASASLEMRGEKRGGKEAHARKPRLFRVNFPSQSGDANVLSSAGERRCRRRGGADVARGVTTSLAPRNATTTRAGVCAPVAASSLSLFSHSRPLLQHLHTLIYSRGHGVRVRQIGLVSVGKRVRGRESARLSVLLLSIGPARGALSLSSHLAAPTIATPSALPPPFPRPLSCAHTTNTAWPAPQHNKTLTPSQKMKHKTLSGSSARRRPTSPPAKSASPCARARRPPTRACRATPCPTCAPRNGPTS
jgi:hypothetical protein